MRTLPLLSRIGSAMVQLLRGVFMYAFNEKGSTYSYRNSDGLKGSLTNIAVER